MSGARAKTDAAAIEPSTTRAQAIVRIGAYLAERGVDEAAREARALLLAAADLKLLDLTLSPQAPLDAAAARRLEDFAARRGAREPLSRIVGTRGFWTLDLIVAPDVLDPRGDTETLVEFALDLMGDRRNAPLAILDLGSGSGAILCALLSELPAARGLAVDLSAKACAATADNLVRCGLAGRAGVLRGRWADAIDARFDLVVSNPPYIPSGEIAGLGEEVLLHDPLLALDGGADGLDCHRAIVRELPRLLADGGAALLEVASGQAARVAALLETQGLAPAGVRRDAGGRERVVAARRAPGAA